jgi:hypothetical protein
MKTMPANPGQLRKVIWNYWSTYQSGAIKVDQATATAPMVPNRQKALGNLAQEKSSKSCPHCAENGRERVKNSNDLDNCFFKDFRGKGFPSKSGKSLKSTANNSELMKQVEALSEAVANLASFDKATSNYFHDTGCTPTSFVKVKPPDLKIKLGSVSTAGGDSFRTLGTGTVKFGSLSTPVTYCPDFAKNLISGIAINNQGLHQTIGNNHLVVYNGVLDKKTIPVTTGKINTDVGLIEMDHEVNPLAVPIILNTNKALVSFQGKSWNVHESLGHCGDSMMRRSSDKFP